MLTNALETIVVIGACEIDNYIVVNVSIVKARENFMFTSAKLSTRINVTY